MEKKTLNIEGMSCENCVKAVTKAVNDLSGTKNVKVDLKTGKACLEFDTSKTNLNDIKAAIEKKGFTVKE